jgi:hypothetical protein
MRKSFTLKLEPPLTAIGRCRRHEDMIRGGRRHEEGDWGESGTDARETANLSG